MTKALFIRRGDALFPTDDESRELLSNIKSGKEIMMEIKPVRSGRHHRLFWALMQLVAENVEGFASAEHVSVAVRIACHEVDTFIMPDTGEVRYVPRSLKYESMDQARFNRFFDRALYVICNRWLQGVETEALRAEVYAMVDGAAAIGRRVA